MSDEFEIRSDPTTDSGVSCPCTSGEFPINLLWEKCCGHYSDFNFDWIFFNLAGNKDIHKNLDEFNELATLERLKNQCIMWLHS